MDELSLRVSDGDREHAVLTLREHLLSGRLTLEEFGERVGSALHARTAGELADTQLDLPPAIVSRRRGGRLTAALFAHVVRRGRLRLPRRMFALSAFADIDLDVREAQPDRAVTTIWVLGFFGNVDVYVPEGIDADVAGLAVFGHRRDFGRDVAPVGAPAIRVRAVGFMATIDVWRVPVGAKGGYRELMKATRGEIAAAAPPDPPALGGG